MSSYVASCQPLWNTRKGEGRGKRTRRTLVCRIPANRTVRSCVILDCVEVGRDHRSIRTGQGNEGGLETVISKVHIYIYGGTNEFVRVVDRVVIIVRSRKVLFSLSLSQDPQVSTS